jgi:hypothetical protein
MKIDNEEDYYCYCYLKHIQQKKICDNCLKRIDKNCVDVYFCKCRHKIIESDKNKELECSICLEDIELEDIKKLKCGHIYHTKCISEWKKENNTCPICRKISTSIVCLNSTSFNIVPDTDHNSNQTIFMDMGIIQFCNYVKSRDIHYQLLNRYIPRTEILYPINYNKIFNRHLLTYDVLLTHIFFMYVYNDYIHLSLPTINNSTNFMINSDYLNNDDSVYTVETDFIKYILLNFSFQKYDSVTNMYFSTTTHLTLYTHLNNFVIVKLHI